jgi:transcriptional regulator with XRE-family HTH domain
MPGKKREPEEARTVTQQLREQMRRSGLNLVQLSELSGVSAAQLSRFLNAKRGLNTDTVDRLCTALGLQLTKVRKKPTDPGGAAP